MLTFARSVAQPAKGAPVTPEGALVASGPAGIGVVIGHIPQGRDYNSEGHYLHGPKRRRPPTSRLDKLTRARCEEKAEPPAAARGRMESDRQRRLRVLTQRAEFLAMLAEGKNSRPTGRRNRRAA